MKRIVQVTIYFIFFSGYNILFSCQSSDNKAEKTEATYIKKLEPRITGILPSSLPFPDSLASISVKENKPEAQQSSQPTVTALARKSVPVSKTKKPLKQEKSVRNTSGVKTRTSIPKSPVNRVNLKTEVNFSQDLPKGLRKQVTTDYGFVVDKQKTWKGQALARLELRPTDITNGVVRSEILLDSDTEPEAKYGWVMYFPKEYWAPSNEYDIVMQLHGHDDKLLGEKARNPQFALFVNKDRLKVAIHHSDLPVNTNKDDIDEKFDLGPLPKDQFLEIVLEIRHSYEPDGYAKLYVNGKKVLDYKGGTSYNDLRKYPYFKAGIYNRKVKFDRVVYISSIRRGNAKANYKDVAP